MLSRLLKHVYDPEMWKLDGEVHCHIGKLERLLHSCNEIYILAEYHLLNEDFHKPTHIKNIESIIYY
jgi:hypothetical protein